MLPTPESGPATARALSFRILENSQYGECWKAVEKRLRIFDGTSQAGYCFAAQFAMLPKNIPYRTKL